MPGATGSTLLLGQKQIDRQITARVTATAKGYKRAVATTTATAPVGAGTITVTAPFTISGRPRHGETPTIRPGTVEPADASVTCTWLRDDAPVHGAVRPVYTLAADDVGRSISVRAEYTRSSYRSTAGIVEVTGLVTTVPELRVRPIGKPGHAAIGILVKAPGLPAPSGHVTVRVGGRRVTAQLINGRSRLVIDSLRAGTNRSSCATPEPAWCGPQSRAPPPMFCVDRPNRALGGATPRRHRHAGPGRLPPPARP